MFLLTLFSISLAATPAWILERAETRRVYEVPASTVLANLPSKGVVCNDADFGQTAEELLRSDPPDPRGEDREYLGTNGYTVRRNYPCLAVGSSIHRPVDVTNGVWRMVVEATEFDRTTLFVAGKESAKVVDRLEQQLKKRASAGFNPYAQQLGEDGWAERALGSLQGADDETCARLVSKLALVGRAAASPVFEAEWASGGRCAGSASVVLVKWGYAPDQLASHVMRRLDANPEAVFVEQQSVTTYDPSVAALLKPEVDTRLDRALALRQESDSAKRSAVSRITYPHVALYTSIALGLVSQTISRTCRTGRCRACGHAVSRRKNNWAAWMFFKGLKIAASTFGGYQGAGRVDTSDLFCASCDRPWDDSPAGLLGWLAREGTRLAIFVGLAAWFVLTYVW